MLSRICKEENLFIIINSSLLISYLINGLIRRKKKLENHLSILKNLNQRSSLRPYRSKLRIGQ